MFDKLNARALNWVTRTVEQRDIGQRDINSNFDAEKKSIKKTNRHFMQICGIETIAGRFAKKKKQAGTELHQAQHSLSLELDMH